MTFSTSIVAACCSIRSPYSLFRSASAAVRSSNSRYVSALVIAITACSAKVCRSAIWVSLNPAPPEGFPFSPMTPTGSPRRNSGTATTD